MAPSHTSFQQGGIPGVEGAGTGAARALSISTMCQRLCPVWQAARCIAAMFQHRPGLQQRSLPGEEGQGSGHLPSYLSRMVLDLEGVVKQKGSYPNLYVDHEILE